jgi:hypothetical protein
VPTPEDSHPGGTLSIPTVTSKDIAGSQIKIPKVPKFEEVDREHYGVTEVFDDASVQTPPTPKEDETPKNNLTGIQAVSPLRRGDMIKKMAMRAEGMGEKRHGIEKPLEFPSSNESDDETDLKKFMSKVQAKHDAQNEALKQFWDEFKEVKKHKLEPIESKELNLIVSRYNHPTIALKPIYNKQSKYCMSRNFKVNIELMDVETDEDDVDYQFAQFKTMYPYRITENGIKRHMQDCETWILETNLAAQQAAIDLYPDPNQKILNAQKETGQSPKAAAVIQKIAAGKIATLGQTGQPGVTTTDMFKKADAEYVEDQKKFKEICQLRDKLEMTKEVNIEKILRDRD